MARVILISLCIILMLSHVLAFQCIRERISPNEGNDGFIHSPNYPREYPSNSCYIWYHMVSTVTKVVIKIQDLDIPSMDSCRSNSSNRLFIGPHNKHQYCGTVQSDIVYETVISDYFYIVFIISESNTPRGRGFLLHYELSTPDDLSTPKRAPTTTIIPPRSMDDSAHEGTNPPCFFSTTDSYGIITIPKAVLPSTHHFQYGDGSKSCTWLLDAPNYPWLKLDSPLFRYALRFEQFHFFPDCCSLDIYEGSDDHSGRLVGHYFSASHPHSLYALGPQVFMKLYFNNNDYFGNFTIHFQREELCRSGYSACSFNETGCYPVGKRCDGVWDCPLKGGDERGCTSSCSDHKFSCGNSSAYCFSEQDRCNGKGACANYRDEQDCSPLQCSSDKGLFLCKNKRCIYEKWRCDHTSDCEDGSDEEGCDRLSSPRLIIACVVGTLISSLLLVLALSFAIRVYALRMRRRHGDQPVRHESLLSRIEEDLLRRRAPPPQYNEAMMTSRSYDEAYLELLNNNSSSSNAAAENNASSSSTQDGGNSNTNNNSSTATTNGSSRRERGRRSGNRRRNGRDRRLHRNLRIQRQQQHLHGCAPSPILPPPPLPLHYFTELPPSYSDSTSGAATGELVPTLLSSDNDPSFVNSDLNSGDGRNHELQPMSSVVISSASASSNTTTVESNPPPYSLHNELQSDSSGSDLDDDDDDDLEDDDDDDDMINIDEQDGYVNFSSSSSRRVVGDDDDDDCLLLTGDGSDNDLDEDENEEDDTCLSVIPESTHAHMLSLSSPPIPPNITISSDLMTATELQQMSTFFKEEEDDSPSSSDKKEEQVVGGGGGSSKDGGEEEDPIPTTQTTTTPEESCQSQTTNVAQSSMKEGKPSQPCNSNGQPTIGSNSAVDNDDDDDDDDDECILSGEGAVLGSESEFNEDTSDTAHLLAS